MNNENKNTEEHTLKLNGNLTQDFKGDFYIDSGATQHLVNDIYMFTDFNSNAEPVKIIIADGKSLVSQGIGNVHILTKLSDGTSHDVIQIDVYFLPELFVTSARFVNKKIKFLKEYN